MRRALYCALATVFIISTSIVCVSSSSSSPSSSSTPPTSHSLVTSITGNFSFNDENCTWIVDSELSFPVGECASSKYSNLIFGDDSNVGYLQVFYSTDGTLATVYGFGDEACTQLLGGTQYTTGNPSFQGNCVPSRVLVSIPLINETGPTPPTWPPVGWVSQNFVTGSCVIETIDSAAQLQPLNTCLGNGDRAGVGGSNMNYCTLNTTTGQWNYTNIMFNDPYCSVSEVYVSQVTPSGPCAMFTCPEGGDSSVPPVFTNAQPILFTQQYWFDDYYCQRDPMYTHSVMLNFCMTVGFGPQLMTCDLSNQVLNTTTYEIHLGEKQSCSGPAIASNTEQVGGGCHFGASQMCFGPTS